MVERTEYLKRLNSFRDEKVIKVITGIRRSGKSTLLKQYQELLLSSGVDSSQIVSLNLEELENEEFLDYRKLYEFIKNKLKKGRMTYVFLDEIQRVNEFQKVVDSIHVKENVDIYITGSNSYLLSGELATLLSGRYVEISLLPLSFKEFFTLNNTLSPENAFSEYLRFGGLPYLASVDGREEKADFYLEGIYNTVIVKDIEERMQRRDRGERQIVDISLLKAIARFLSSVIGSPVSIKKISDYLISSGRKVSPNTVSSYVDALCESFIFYPAHRIDVVGKQLLKTNGKMYIVDLGLRNHLVPRCKYDFGFSLENVVFLELLRRGYNVSVGKVGNLEVDFVAKKNGILEYFQISATLRDEETFNREIRSLEAIGDNYPKYIITSDNLTVGNYNGINVVNIIQWLLSEGK